MAKKCAPGVICIENITLFFIILLVIIGAISIYSYSSPRTVSSFAHPTSFLRIPNIPYTNLDTPDVLRDPYVPPLRDERYMNVIPGNPVVPVNVSSNPGAVDTTYRQVGILTPVSNKDNSAKILPLMGRPLFVNRDTWQYYSMSDQNNSVKLPVMQRGKSCTNEYGCNRILNGDNVYVKGYNESFTATMYEEDTIRYLPFL
jgi:Family of unknown function (DUF5755)